MRTNTSYKNSVITELSYFRELLYQSKELYIVIFIL